MLSIIFTVILVIVAVVAFAVGVHGGRKAKGAEYSHDRDDALAMSFGGRFVGVVALLIAVVIMLFAVTTSVGAKHVGVQTTFGKVSDATLDPGLHFKSPFSKVTEIDATVQTDEYQGKSCIRVRIGDGNTACTAATIRWSVSPRQANQVYADFRSGQHSDDPTEALRDAVVSTQFKAALNTVMGTYDPTAGFEDTGDLSTGNVTFVPDYADLDSKVTTAMEKQTKGLVNITSITISEVVFSEKTEKRISDFQSEIAKTRIAKQAQATAAQQAKANETLAKSVSKDPNVLVAQCLQALADKEFTPPAGFSCWPGGGSSVVVPSAK